MTTTEQHEVLVIGSREVGNYVAWTLLKEGHRAALVERKMLGGWALSECGLSAEQEHRRTICR